MNDDDLSDRLRRKTERERVPYITLRGEVTDQNDPERGLWYSSFTDKCGYWTDDWTKLALVGPGIPVCPVCGCVGMQTTAGQWDRDVSEFEANGHPHYRSYVASRKERCLERASGGWKASYEAHRAKQEG